MALNEVCPRFARGVTLVLVLALALLMGLPAPIVGTAAAASPDRMLKNGETFPDGFVVPAGQTWAFDPAHDTTVTVSGNVEVQGRLEMKPNSKTIQHNLTFTGIDEDAFAGAQMGESLPVPTDVGLWVLGAGQLDVQGTTKTAWSYKFESGWAGDEVRATPVAKGNFSSFPVVTSTPAANALGFKPELLNLTRNVTIQGTPAGKTHLFIKSSQPQTIRYATIRYVAPDFEGGPGQGTGTTGRYGMHFHHNMDGSRGSLVEGVVIRDAENHAFVPHGSNGITFRDTIAFNTTSEAYWWDESTAANCGTVAACNSSDDTLYDGVVAALTHTSPYSVHTSSAIQLGEGDGNAILNSVAVGLQGGGANNAGYIWPSAEDGVWLFENNIAHNNQGNGIFVWQNTGKTHIVNAYTAYHNHKAAIDHGAYGNAYVYLNLILLDNGVAIESHARGKKGSDGLTDTQRWENIDTGGKGVMTPMPHQDTQKVTPVRFTHCDFAEVAFNEVGGAAKSAATGGLYDFVECGLSVDDFDLGDAAAATVIRVQDGTSAYQLTGTGTKTTIPPFFTVNPPLPPPPGGEPPSGSGFLDTAGSVFAADIAWLAETGITKGCNPPLNTMFCPNDIVTRGQMAAFLNRSLDLGPGPDRFEDTAGSVFVDDINALAEAGITKGCNPPANSLFCPDGDVTREQMAAFLVRAFDLPPAADRFTDVSGSVFEADISSLAAAGITLGCNPPANTEFCPRQPVTRGQMAAFLHRSAEHLPGQ